MALLTVAGTALPDPHDVKLTRFPIKKENRTASGRLVVEIIAYKRRLQVTWALMRDPDLQTLLTLLEDHGPFVQVDFAPEGAEPQSMVAAVEEPIETGLWYKAPDGSRFWRDVTVTFVER